jgi:hypothetical protein
MMSNIKLKNLLKENMRRFGTKNLNESNDITEFTKQYIQRGHLNDAGEMADVGTELAELLERPKMEYLQIVQQAVALFKKWTDAKKPAPFSVYMLVHEAPALIDKMQSGSKRAWDEMASHLGGIVDAVSDEDKDEYVTDYQPDSDDLI